MHRHFLFVLMLAFGLAACQPAAPAPTQAVTKLRFTDWGSEMKKAAIEQMVTAFEKQTPDIAVEPLFPFRSIIPRLISFWKSRARVVLARSNQLGAIPIGNKNLYHGLPPIEGDDRV